MIDIKQQLKYKEKFKENRGSEELQQINEGIKMINEMINQRLGIINFGRDFTIFRNEIVDKMSVLHQRQHNQIKGLKFILQNGSISKNKVLLDDLDDIYAENDDFLNPITTNKDNMKVCSKCQFS